MNKLSITLIFFFILSLLINFKTCSDKEEITEEYIKGKKDTVFVKLTDTVFNLKPVYIKSKKEFIKDTLYLKDTVLYINDSLELNEFKTYYKDSLIEATINSKVKGILLSSNFSYSYNKELISSTDTIIKTVLNNKNRFYIGAFYGNNSINPSLLFSYKNKYIFKVSYNINNNYPYIGAYFNIK